MCACDQCSAWAQMSFRVLRACSWSAVLSDDGLEDASLSVQVLTTCAETNDAMRYHRIIVTPHFEIVTEYPPDARTDVDRLMTTDSLTVPDNAAARRALGRWTEMRRASSSHPLRDWTAVLWELEVIVAENSD